MVETAEHTNIQESSVHVVGHIQSIVVVAVLEKLVALVVMVEQAVRVEDGTTHLML